MDRYGELDENILIGKVMLGEAAKQLDILTRGKREGIWRHLSLVNFPSFWAAMNCGARRNARRESAP